jgi:HEAT repeat protein
MDLPFIKRLANNDRIGCDNGGGLFLLSLLPLRLLFCNPLARNPKMRPTCLPAPSYAQLRNSRRFIACVLAVLVGLAADVSIPWCAADDQTTADLAERIASSDRTQRLEAIRQAARSGPGAKSAVPQLIAALDAEDLSVRYEAVHALAAIGPHASAAVEPLTELLSDDLDLLQYAAVTALRQIADSGNPELLERLHKLASQGGTPDVRVAAARTLATLAGEDGKSALQPDVVNVLVEGLASADDHVSSDAIHGLAAAGGAATDSILPLLESKDETTRANAADALAILGLSAPSATPALIRSLDTAEGHSTRHLLRALAAVGSDPEVAIPAVLKVLDQQSSDETRLTALRALGEFGAEAAPAVPSIVALLEGDDPRMRMEAVETLGEIGPAASAAVPPLMQVLQGEDGLLTITAAHALSQIGEAAVGPLRAMLSESGYQLLAATILGDIGPAAAGAVPELVRLIDAEDEDVRRAALLALAGIGPGAASAAERLLQALNTSDYPARAGAAYALAHIGAKEAVGDLQRIMAQSDDERLRMTAAWALVILDPETVDTDRILPALVAGLDDPWELVRRECVSALAVLGPRARSTIDRLLPLLDDPDPLVRAETLVALQRLGADVESLLPRLIEGLDDETSDTRYACAYVLGQLGENARPAVPRLKELLNHRREFDRVVAAWALAKIDPTPATRELAVPLMIGALTNPSAQVRREAAATLGELGDGRAAVLEALRTALDDPAPEVQQAARRSLEQLGGA